MNSRTPISSRKQPSRENPQTREPSAQPPRHFPPSTRAGGCCSQAAGSSVSSSGNFPPPRGSPSGTWTPAVPKTTPGTWTPAVPKTTQSRDFDESAPTRVPVLTELRRLAVAQAPKGPWLHGFIYSCYYSLHALAWAASTAARLLSASWRQVRPAPPRPCFSAFSTCLWPSWAEETVVSAWA